MVTVTQTEHAKSPHITTGAQFKLRGMTFSHFSGCSAVYLGFSHGFHAQLHHSVESGSSPPVQWLGGSGWGSPLELPRVSQQQDS